MSGLRCIVLAFAVGATLLMLWPPVAAQFDANRAQSGARNPFIHGLPAIAAAAGAEYSVQRAQHEWNRFARIEIGILVIFAAFWFAAPLAAKGTSGARKSS